MHVQKADLQASLFQLLAAHGGLGGAVAEILCEAGYGGKFKRIGMPDQFSVLGDPDEIYHFYGMDRDGVAKTIQELLHI